MRWWGEVYPSVVKREGRKKQAEVVEGLIEKVEAGMGKDVKATVAEYIRLVQLQKDMQEDEPRSIEVRWVDAKTEDDSDEEK
jgi:hypothetical protein